MAVGRTSEYSIRTRIKQEIVDPKIGGRINRAIQDSNLSAIVSINDMIIRYVDLTKMIGEDNSEMNGSDLEQITKDLELVIFAGGFPTLNTKRGN